MRTDEIKRKLLALEQKSAPEAALCIVRFPDGTQGKVSVIEWYDHRKEWEWLDSVANTDCSPPVFFILYTLIESTLCDELKAGKPPDDPEIQDLKAELAMYRKIITGE